MSPWFILLFIIGGALLFFQGWTFLILLRQKAAWKAYAAKRKLRYKSLAFMNASEVSGVVDEHTISIFTSEHIAEDIRGSRKLTALEVNLNSTMPIFGGVASGGMVPILQGLRLKQQYRPDDHAGWNESYIAAADNRTVLQSYLTPERLDALCDLMTLPNVWVMFIFRDERMLLRVDTADPLDNPAKVDSLVKTMLKVANVLELKPGESKRLKKEEAKSMTRDLSLEVDEKAFEESAEIELEDDQEEKGGSAAEESSEKEKE